MNLTKKDKIKRSENLAEELKGASSIFFASYKGLKFQNMALIRSRLEPSKCCFRVIRNTIALNALRNMGAQKAPDAQILKGPTALAIQKDGDIVDAARALSGFEKEFPALKIKAGFSADKWYDAAQCKRLAGLGGRQQQLSMLAGSLYNCVALAANVLQAPIRDLAYVLKAVEDKKKETGAAAA